MSAYSLFARPPWIPSGLAASQDHGTGAANLPGVNDPIVPTLPGGICVFGLTYACGLTWAGTPKANPRPLDAFGLIELAAARGLASVEFPPGRMLPDTTPATLARARRAAEARGLAIILPAGRVERDHLSEQLEVARQLGAPVVRCTLSPLLCGDRRPLAPDGDPLAAWRTLLEAAASELAAVLPLAERYRIALAVENHQDAGSEDLLQLCRRFESRYLGVTLDTGNPLAVLEEPVAFAERLAPYLRHAHLKDYRVFRADTGFRLVRCAMGRGVIDFPALYRLFDRQEWPITRNIEMGALQARLIPFLEPSWWDGYPPRDVREVAAALAAVWGRFCPGEEEWRTPFERDAPAEELAAWEWEEFEASVGYLGELESVA